MQADQISRCKSSSAVDDLLWAFFSPSLLGDSPDIVQPAWLTSIRGDILRLVKRLRTDPSPLKHALSSRHSHFLGAYFETLIQYGLAQLPYITLQAERSQVFENGRTIGDFDILFTDLRTGESYHWELAIKFYLGVVMPNSEHLWYGTNANDRLDLKVDKILSQQLPLSQHASAQAQLQDLPQPLYSQALVKGMLFYPLQENIPALPDYVAEDHLRGWWCRAGDCFSTEQTSRWKLLKKPHWLSMTMFDPDHDGMNLQEMNDFVALHFSCSEQALLIGEFQNEKGDQWRAVSRGYIVHKTWPTPPRKDGVKL